MKSLILILFFFAAAATAQNVSVTDYQVPISKAKTLRFDGSWSWSQTGNTVTSNNANANLIYRTFYSSLPTAWFINIDASGGKNFDTYTNNEVLDASFRKYIWDNKDWFGSARVTAQYADYYKQLASDLTVGFGYGRYINATALAKAVRIEDHLLSDNIISGYLPKEIIIEVAYIIEREAEYRDIYGSTYESRWFEDIESEILKSGLVKGNNLGSLGIFRIRQVLFGINERINPRYYGWDINAGILFHLTTFDKSPTGNPNLSLSGRYSIPISWQLQVNTVAEAFTPLDTLFSRQLTARLGIDFIYELSSRINFVSGYRLGFTKYPNLSALTEHNLNLSFWYYLENNIYLTISGNFSKQGNNPKLLSSIIGLQYNLF